MPDRIEAFIEAVAAEIRWKKVRPVLALFPLTLALVLWKQRGKR